MKRLTFISFLTLPIVIFVICSCSDKNNEMSYFNLSNLPADTGGTHISCPLGSTESPYGYYVYMPSGYDKTEESFYPVLIFLHGSGEKGNSETDANTLNLVLHNGPPKMITKGTWHPVYPMLVFSPQCHDGGWQAQKVKSFVDYILATYKVNVRRIYLTGLSMGGYGCFQYIGTMGDNSTIAAVVPICGGGNTNQAQNFVNIPVWAFHGEDDSTVLPEKSIDMIEAINATGPIEQARITLYPGIGHNSWDFTYEGTGMGKEDSEYDSFNETIYSWMFRHQKVDQDSLMHN